MSLVFGREVEIHQRDAGRKPSLVCVAYGRAPVGFLSDLSNDFFKTCREIPAGFAFSPWHSRHQSSQPMNL